MRTHTFLALVLSVLLTPALVPASLHAQEPSAVQKATINLNTATVDQLMTLPGVGRKTANVVLGNGFGQQTIGVDTHVMRLSQRLRFTTKTDPDRIEADLMAIVPEKKRVRFCHLMQYHGRRICLAKKPKCSECTIEDLCPFPGKTV